MSNKKVELLETLYRFLTIRPYRLTPGYFLIRANVLELIGRIYFFDDSDFRLEEIKKLLDSYMKGVEWSIEQELADELRRVLADRLYEKRVSDCLQSVVLKEFIKAFTSGVMGDKELGSLISVLRLVRKALKKDRIKTLQILNAQIDGVNEALLRWELKRIISENPKPELEPQTTWDDELPF